MTRPRSAGAGGVLGTRGLSLSLLLLVAHSAPAWSVATEGGWSSRWWRVEDGLPTNVVTGVAQTPDGYLWLSTLDGLVRFDGTRFEIFSSSQHRELPSDRLTTLFVDADGDLWTTTVQQDLLRFRNGVFERFGLEQGLPDDRVVFWANSGDEIWIGTLGGAARCRRGKCEPLAESLATAGVLALAEGAEGSIWIGTDGRGLLRLDTNGDLVAFGADRSRPDVETVCTSRDGTPWVGGRRGVARLEGQRLIPVDPADGERIGLVLRCERAADGALYFATDTGLFVAEGDRLTRRSHNRGYLGAEPLVVETPAGLAVNLRSGVEIDGRTVLSSSSPITSLLVDRERNLWIATDGGGLARLRPTPVTTVGSAEGLPGENVYPIVEGPPGTIWMGVLGHGLVRLKEGTVNAWSVPEGLPNDAVWAIVPDGPDSAWVGSGGLRRFEDGLFHRQGVDPRLVDTNVRALLRDRAGALWVGREDPGLFRLTGAGWERWGTELGVPSAPIRVLAQTPDDALWLGTNGAGIARCVVDRGCERLTSELGLPSDLVRALWSDENGVVWVGTENRGLVRVDARSGPLATAELTSVRKSHGLFTDGIHQIVDDALGRLWMSSNRGIFWVEHAELEAFASGALDEVRSFGYTEADGMRSREANGGVQSAGLRTSDGELWFPTQAGAVVVDPRRVEKNELPPPVVIEQIEASSPDGARVLIPSRRRQDVPRLELRLGERNLRIQYTAPSFVASERIRFRYRLGGVDAGWTDAGTSRQLSLSYLPPGSYRLRVIAANGDGVWNTEGAAVDLVLPAHFWETRTFDLSLGAILLLVPVAGGLWRRRHLQRRHRELELRVAEQTTELSREKRRVEQALRQVERQAEQLRELDRAKSHFFGNVSHELRTPLTLLLGPLLDADRRNEAVAEDLVPAMRRNAQRLQRMIEQILDLQKLEAGTMTLALETLDLRPLSRRVIEAFASLAERRGVDLSADVPDAPVVARVDPEQIERVLGNLISNALRFTSAGGRIEMELTACEEHVRLAVSDTGCGIPPEALPRLFERFYQVDGSSTRAREGMGVGLALARELMQLHGGDIEVDSVVGEGTRFRLTLPRVREAPAREAERAVTLDESDLPDGESRPPDSAEDGAGRPAVLIVDDNADVRAYLRRILGGRFSVFEAENGIAALELAREELPDLIIADVMMPEMDGFALGRALREDPMTGGVPLVYLTARASEEDALEGFASSAVAYLTKPFDTASLLARVDALLGQQHRLRERLRSELAATSAETDEPADCGPFERRLREIASAHLHDEGFGVEQLATSVHLARNSVYRRLKDEGGPSPADLLREIRLERARQLLVDGEGNVSEIAYAVGFETLTGFGRAYRRHFGVAPSEHLGRGGH